MKITSRLRFAGMVGDLLNWRGWAPLSRLTFAAYLIHPAIWQALVLNRFDLIYLDKWALVSTILAKTGVRTISFAEKFI